MILQNRNPAFSNTFFGCWWSLLRCENPVQMTSCKPFSTVVQSNFQSKRECSEIAPLLWSPFCALCIRSLQSSYILLSIVCFPAYTALLNKCMNKLISHHWTCKNYHFAAFPITAKSLHTFQRQMMVWLASVSFKIGWRPYFVIVLFFIFSLILNNPANAGMLKANELQV